LGPPGREGEGRNGKGGRGREGMGREEMGRDLKSPTSKAGGKGRGRGE